MAKKLEIGNDDWEGKSKGLKKRDVYETCGKTCPVPDLTEDDPYSLYDFNVKDTTKVYTLSQLNKEVSDILNLLEQSREDARKTLREEGLFNMASLSACTYALWMYRAVNASDQETAKATGDSQQRTINKPVGVKVRNLRNLCIGRCLAITEKGKLDIQVVIGALKAGTLQTEDFGGVITQFRLYTRGNPNSYQVIKRKDPSSLTSSNFKTSRDTKFIIHGWTQDGDDPFVIDMKNALLRNADYNVISVDWQEGAGKASYFPSARNVYIVGDIMDLFIRFLKKEADYSYKRVHLIGFSLGAQCSGQAGMRNPSIGRISGLDPASLNFENKDNSEKLDASDAQFVDVMHTDGDTLGTWEETGDVDFYPNGGEDQPECFNIGKRDVSAKGSLGCDHGKAPEYFIESITSACKFLSCPCQPGKTCNCSSGQNYMGFHATESPNGAFYLETFTYNEQECKESNGVCDYDYCCPNKNYGSGKCPKQAANVKCCYSNPNCSGVRGTCGSSVQSLACEILNHDSVNLLDINPSGVDDGADVYSNILDTCNGMQAKRSSYHCREGCAPGGYTCLKNSVLQYILDVLNSNSATPNNKLQVNSIAGACHSSTSWHYYGTAVGFQIPSGSNNYETWMNMCSDRGAVQNFGPGDKNHDTHTFCAFGS